MGTPYCIQFIYCSDCATLNIMYDSGSYSWTAIAMYTGSELSLKIIYKEEVVDP